MILRGFQKGLNYKSLISSVNRAKRFVFKTVFSIETVFIALVNSCYGCVVFSRQSVINSVLWPLYAGT